MATTVTPQSVTALDTAGVTTVTTTVNAAHPQQGRFYNSTTWAAANPIWFHPTFASGVYLMLAARRWYAATPSTTTPGSYSSYSEDTAPCWCLFNAVTGSRTDVSNAVTHMPRRVTASSATLTGAASRAPNYVYPLLSATVNGTRCGVLQHFTLTTSGSVTLVAEEVLPATSTVVFDKGVQYDTPYLMVYGTDSSGNVYRMRKHWGRVGVNTTSPAFSKLPVGIGTGTASWEYYTGQGYSVDASEAAPLLPVDDSTSTTAGHHLTSIGPLSFASLGKNTVLTTVMVSSGAVTGQAWVSRSGRPFTRLGSPVPLGTQGSSYLGGGMQLQPQLHALSDSSVLYVSTIKGNGSLLTSWASLAVS